MEEPITNFFQDRGFAAQGNQDILPELQGNNVLDAIPDTSLLNASPLTAHQLKVQANQLDFMKKSIEQKAMKLSLFDKDKIGQSNTDSILKDLTTSKVNLVDFEVDLDETYQRLNDGTYVAKFENYISGTNNEERLASTQSAWEQALNGVGKGIAKTGLNILDGTVGTVVGLVNGISQGSFSAVYNNDFSKWIDDLNTKMDYNLPNYYTQEQKNMGFLESLGTTNFWANDFMGGMSFMLGTIGSEAIWATVTGGASLATTLPRLTLKAGASGLARTVGKQSAKNFYKNSLKMLKAYNRTIPVSQAGQVFNNARFLYTSAGYEAGVEARHSLNESLESFVASTESTFGRKPTAEEYKDFFDGAIDNTNKIFAANVGLVGASNIAQFGTYFGLGTGINKTITKAFGKTFGLGITKTLDDSGKIVYNAIKPSRLQRITGNTLDVLKAPFIEGFVEEGGQSVISKTSQRWLASRFNPDSLRENYSVIEAATEAFADTYGTKEGGKEIGLGMLIGFFGGAGKRGAQGQRTPFNVGQFNSQVQRNETLATNLNDATLKMTDVQKSLINRLTLNNQFNTYVNKSKSEADKGNLFQASIDWDTAQYTKMLMEDSASMLDESVADFKRVLDATPNEEFINDYGLNEDQIADYKMAILDNYEQNVALYKKAKQIAEAVNPTGFDLNNAKQDYTQELGLNIYLGSRALSRANDVAESIDEMIGTEGIASALNLYTNITKKAKTRAERLVRLESELQTLENEYADLQQSFTSTNQNKEQRQGENQEVANQVTKNEQRRDKVFEQLTKKREELSELEGQLENRFYKSKFAFGGNLDIFKDINTDEALISDVDLINSVKELNKLDSYKEILKDQNPKAYDALNTLLEEYVKNVKAFRDFNLVYEQMADPRFARESYKGITKLFKNVGTEFDDSSLESTPLDVNTEALNNYLEANKNNLTEDEVFTLKTLHRMSTAFYLNVKIGNYNTPVDTVSSEDWETFIDTNEVTESIINDIANKLKLNLPLSERETAIRQSKSEEVEEVLRNLKMQEGDSLANINTSNNDIESQLKDIEERRQEELDINGLQRNDVGTQGKFESYKGKKVEITVTAVDEKGETAINKPTVGYQVNIAPKSGNGFKFSENLSNSFDTFEEAKEYANKFINKEEKQKEINAKYNAEIKRVKENSQPLDESTLANRLKNIINKIKSSNSYLSDFDVNEFNKDDIPTEAEYKEFNKLFKQQNKGTLTPKKNERFNILKTKINNWGKLEGTLTDKKVVLSDLLEQVALIEDQSFNPDVTLPSVTDLDDLVDAQEFKATQKNNNYDNLQNPDKAMVTRDSFDNYAISNINLNGFLNIVENDLNFTLERKGKIVTRGSNGWNIGTIEQDQRYTLKYDNEGNLERFSIRIGRGNNLVVTEETKNKINELTSIKIYPTNNLPTNFQPLMREVQDGETTRLIPVDTNFEYARGMKVNVEAIFNLKPDDLVYLEVDTEDSYNKKLLSKYNKADEEGKLKLLPEIENNLVIYAKDAKNKFLGVHKAATNLDSSTDENLVALQKVRKVALQRVLTENFIENQVIDLGISIPVSKVYQGHPNFNVVNKNGKVFVENIPFTDESVKLVKDIGYIKDGEVILKNNSSNYNTYPFATKIIRGQKYKGKKVPVMVFDFQGQSLVYPVTLNPIATDVSESLDSIIDTNMSTQDKILALNNLLIQYDIDVNQNGFTFDNFNQSQVDKVKSLLEQVRDYPDVTEWINSTVSMEDLLKEQATTNIDILDKPFHSPKIKTQINSVNGLNSEFMFDMTVTEDIPSEVEETVKEEQKKDC